MSRVGKKVIHLEKEVKVQIGENNFVEVEGPKGKLDFTFSPKMKIEVKDTNLTVTRPDDSIENRALHGTTRAVLNNMVHGVTKGFAKTLVIEGVGYKASLKGEVLVLAAGYSHLVEMPIPSGLAVKLTSPTELTVEGMDRQKVGQFAAEIRAVRKPEPYKGKGIRYKTEIIRRKEGKKAK